MADPTTFSELIAIATPILVILLIIFQLLDRRDKKAQDLTKPISDLKAFISEELHKGDLEMNNMKHDIKTNQGSIARVEKEQVQVRKETGIILEKLAGNVKAETRRRRKKEESDDGS